MLKRRCGCNSTHACLVAQQNMSAGPGAMSNFGTFVFQALPRAWSLAACHGLSRIVRRGP